MAHRNELYLYRLIYLGVVKGDVFGKNSLEYRSFDDYLVNDRTWILRKKHLSDLGLSWMTDKKDHHLGMLETRFNDKMVASAERISEGNNSYVRRKPNADKLLWSRAVAAKDDTMF